jgi:ankyrin repeat protein
LLEYGADPNKIDRDEKFPLMTAIYNNSIPIITHLVDHGADLS